MGHSKHIALHVVLGFIAVLTMTPFVFVLNNSFRSNTEQYHAFFGLPNVLKDATALVGPALRNDTKLIRIEDESGDTFEGTAREAFLYYVGQAFRGYKMAWKQVRPYMLNSFIVCLSAAACVLFFGSLTAYVLSRYKFPGSKAIFYFVIGPMMFPAVLTLVPSFLLVKQLGLLNSYWAMILPYIAGGQMFAIFIFKGFFDGLPEDLFEAARIDGASHLQMYWQIVLPLSKPIISVVLIMNILGNWNNFLWPFVTNSDGTHHVIASGLYVIARSTLNPDFSTLFAAYLISSVPLLLMFIYATKPFIQGVTSGAFKA